MLKKRILIGAVIIAALSISAHATTKDVTSHTSAAEASESLTIITKSVEAINQAPTQSAPKEIPLPSAVWLFGSALVGFIKMSSRRHV